MTAQELIKQLNSTGMQLYLDGEQLKYRSPKEPDPNLLNLIRENKLDLIQLLQKQTTIPRLPWQLERLIAAACSGVLVLDIRGIPDTKRYVQAWGCEYLVGDKAESQKRLWEIYAHWQSP
jgi:hypothetical protein